MASLHDVYSRPLVLPLLVFIGLTINKGLLLDLRGKPARQSSSWDSSTKANKAVDGDRDTFMHTGSNGDHWWKVDLEAISSLANITIINRRGLVSYPKPPGHRLAGAVIRAGLDPSDFSLNRMIGSVSSSQATNGAVIDFMTGPNVSARYVSVELAGPSRILHMAEVMVDEEITSTEETNSTVTPVSTSGSTTTGQQDTLTEGNPSITEQGSTITSTTTSITSTASRTLVSTKPQPSIETITKDFPPITSTSETVTAGLTWVTTTLSPSSETAIKVPGPVQNLHWTDRTNSTVTLDWEPPINANGQIQKYIVEYIAREKPHQPDFTPAVDYDRNESESSPFLTENLEPGTKYEFKMSAENQLKIGPGTILEVYTKPQSGFSAPPKPIPFPDDSTDTTVTIGLSPALPDDYFIESYVVQVKKERSSSRTKKEILILSDFEVAPKDYIAAELPKWGVPDRFVVGDAKVYSGYYNAPLQRGAVYNIRVGSVSRGNETDANVEYSDPVTIRVHQPTARSGPNVAAIAVGVIVPVVVVISIVAFLLWKKHKLAHSKVAGTVETAQGDTEVTAEATEQDAAQSLESLSNSGGREY